MKKIAILGSTGSIGTQTLEVVRANGDIQVAAIAAGSNIKMLEAQIREFSPAVCGVWDKEKAKELAALQKKDKANSVIKALLAVILAIVIIIIALIIPKPDKGAEGDTPSTTESTTVSNSGGSTDSGDSNSETPVSPEESTTKAAEKETKTTAEVIDYFNKNANRVKTEATKVVKNYEKRNINKIQAPSVLQSMVDPMKDKFMN